ncbi:hypothetical protein ABH935_007111 [Catenulispora sp. GAS73]|uniref:pPIWI_RE module domain-containing protein n=1 Tax=Catenulispora sp. GAS73 TaxID=3156269 RepID=UPI003511B6AC
MTEIEPETPVKKTRKPAGDEAAPVTFIVGASAKWSVECYIAALPKQWVNDFQKTWEAHPGYKDGHYLPTRRLADLLVAIEPSILYVNSNPHAEAFIVSYDKDIDTAVLTTAIASWADTQLAVDHSGPDWYGLLKPTDLVFDKRTIDPYACGKRPNGTADPDHWMFEALPSMIAKKIVDDGLELLGKKRSFILGPPRSDGRRSAVLFPPQTVSDEQAGDSLVTAKVTVHVQTVPNDPRPHIHADLSTSRFPLRPVTYVPARGDGPPSATIWLHAPNGFLRPNEPHTLLAATATQVPTLDGYRWKWDPGLAGTLARLTHLDFPDPEKVFADPASAFNAEDRISALILYSEGTKSEAVENEEDEEPEIRRARGLVHAANTGFVPDDHLEVQRQLKHKLADVGIVPHPACGRVGPRAMRRKNTPNDPSAVYELELRTFTTLTRDAILDALTHHLKLQRRDESDSILFTGDVNIRLFPSDAEDLAQAVPRKDGKKERDSVLLGRHANWVKDRLGTARTRRATILELENAAYFGRSRQVDPKKPLKKGFARSRRRLQCLTPAKLFKEPKTWKENSKKPKPEPYPGTNFSKGTIFRASAAINDALRQLGHVSSYEVPADVPEMEQIAIEKLPVGNAVVPIVLRMKPGQEPVAYLAGKDAETALTMLYSDLPEYLANGKGRISAGPRQEAEISAFLIAALGVGANGPRDVHDRVVLVRAAAFRSRGWDWLQNKHVTPDRLVLPGVDLDEIPEPHIYLPADCPGLRIVRVRDASSSMEVSRAFTADPENHAVRISGLFQRSERVYLSINPRSDQMQTPLGATKLDQDVTRNFTKQAGNPVPLEIFPAFLQPGDSADTFALYTSGLRRNHLHTDQATAFPGLLHLCKLAAEYL